MPMIYREVPFPAATHDAAAHAGSSYCSLLSPPRDRSTDESDSGNPERQTDQGDDECLPARGGWEFGVEVHEERDVHHAA
jgi:hypothetical protein